MKRDEMEPGVKYMVEAPWTEWASGYGVAVVMAIVREVGVTYSWPGYSRGEKTDGVRCELAEPFRSNLPGGRGELLEHEVGEEFMVASRRVLRNADNAPDAQIRRARAKRYVEQDYVLATMEQRGLPITDRAVSRGVNFELAAFARWLKRVDPVDIAREAIEFVSNAAAQTQEEYDAAVDGALEEIRQGLAVTEAELEARCAVDPGTGI